MPRRCVQEMRTTAGMPALITRPIDAQRGGLFPAQNAVSANSTPSTLAVSTNIDGSIIGDASQKAMTADKGTPMARSAAISGATPQEQKGDTIPARDPSVTMVRGAPLKARAVRLSAPVAPAQAALAIDTIR